MSIQQICFTMFSILGHTGFLQVARMPKFTLVDHHFFYLTEKGGKLHKQLNFPLSFLGNIDFLIKKHNKLPTIIWRRK
tara:strand:+ start:613 stop:846 length:234 start_codon:yes stop_codon:yes gene_type:complete